MSTDVLVKNVNTAFGTVSTLVFANVTIRIQV